MLAPERLSKEARALPGLRVDNIDGTVLATIVNAKVAKLATFTPAPAPEHLAPVRSLAQALSAPGRHFILECKRASPSLGDINLNLDFVNQVNCYNRYASAISVLTEEHFFKGSYAFLQQVKAHTPLPVILKDFVLDERELVHARHIGADAVLLMTSLLTKEKFLELYHKAYALGLQVLCEVSDEEEANFAREHALKIVGINNRNLKTLQIDLSTVKRLRPLLHCKSVVVSESGIKSHQDMVQIPAENFLIGSAVCAPGLSADFAVKTLLFGMNKLCGLTTQEGVQAAIDAKVALAGLIFAPKSPRCVSLDKARQLMAVDKEKQLTFCGVFVDAPLDEVIAHVDALGLPFVQLHGHESPDYIMALQAKRPQLKLIKAFAVSDALIKERVAPYLTLQDKLALYFLFDSKAPGSGKSFDYQFLQGLPHNRALLSGGLGLDNLQEALAQGFLGLDLNSRLERAPGVKDPLLIAQAFTKINQY